MNAMPNLKVICNKAADAYKKIYGDFPELPYYQNILKEGKKIA